jgi:hypothetical protein
LVSTVTRWKQLGIAPYFYEWKALEPDDYKGWLAELEGHRKYTIKIGKWDDHQENDYRREKDEYRGSWRLHNIPGEEDTYDWIGQGGWSSELSDPGLSLEQVTGIFRWNFFNSGVATRVTYFS